MNGLSLRFGIVWGHNSRFARPGLGLVGPSGLTGLNTGAPQGADLHRSEARRSGRRPPRVPCTHPRNRLGVVPTAERQDPEGSRPARQRRRLLVAHVGGRRDDGRLWQDDQLRQCPVDGAATEGLADGLGRRPPPAWRWQRMQRLMSPLGSLVSVQPRVGHRRSDRPVRSASTSDQCWSCANARVVSEHGLGACRGPMPFRSPKRISALRTEHFVAWSLTPLIARISSG